jgi:hypothetical protein
MAGQTRRGRGENRAGTACSPDAAQRAALRGALRCQAGAVTGVGARYGPGSAERHEGCRTASGTLQSIRGNIDHGLRKGLRGFLRQVVADAAADGPVRIFAREHFGIGAGFRMRRTVGVAFQGDGGHGDDRGASKPLFQIVVFRLAFRETEPPAVIMDHDADMIGIVERLRGAIECGIVKIPFRRGELPDQLCEIVPVFLIAVPAALGGCGKQFSCEAS